MSARRPFNHLTLVLALVVICILSESAHAVFLWELPWSGWSTVPNCNSLLTVHTTVSWRRYETVLHSFSDYGEKSSVGVNGIIPAFNPRLEKVKDGHLLLLSLGEGASDFVYELLNAQKKRGVLTVHAADRIYTELENLKNTKAWTSSKVNLDNGVEGPLSEVPVAIVDTVLKFTKTYPENYHGAYFQNMDLKDVSGNTLLFDEIVSYNALNWVLKEANFIESYSILKNIVSHLKIGGVLRFNTMVEHSSPDTVVHQQTMSVIRKLYEDGVISNYAWPLDFKNRGELTQIQR